MTATTNPETRPAHPARYSDAILQMIVRQLLDVGVPKVALDPFAGTGRIHELRRFVPIHRTIGIELEPEWAALHPDTIVGDARRITQLVGIRAVDGIITSPTYGNRMADHHDARDESRRYTYRHSLGRPLTDGNSGAMQWGEKYRQFHRQVWDEAVSALRPGGTFTINVKNHIRRNKTARVMEWHLDHLINDLGLRLVAIDPVWTQGLATGANAGSKIPYEIVATLRRPR